MRIAAATITPHRNAKLNTVTVTLENGRERTLFTYSPDEHRFYDLHFIGITIADARRFIRTRT